ncbi:MAG: TSUP family transporter [Candidatus Borkfalkiaceae bacterium]|nr:TSUP family transporter [Clostridia bacterium]MDY6223892.1 TSUP family transporter [Christensenellaceae bacterium]
MKFYLYLLLGFLGGVPAGMGMGGGTITIPLLLFFGGVPQKIAQSANLFAFLPTGACALNVHVKNGLLQKKMALQTALPALFAAAAGSFAALALPAPFLRKTFGLFLIFLALFSLSSGGKTSKNNR